MIKNNYISTWKTSIRFDLCFLSCFFSRINVENNFEFSLLVSFNARDVYETLRFVVNPGGKDGEKYVFPPVRLPSAMISISSVAFLAGSMSRITANIYDTLKFEVNPSGKDDKKNIHLKDSHP